MEAGNYWNALVSSALHHLQVNGDEIAVKVIEQGMLDIKFNDHDNWNGGIDYWDIVFSLKYKDYILVHKNKKEIEQRIFDAFAFFHSDQSDVISNVIIKPIIEHFINWNAILPETKDSLRKLIEEEQALLTDVAMYRVSYLAEGVETDFKVRHQKIYELADKAKFDYPVKCSSLAEWWNQIKTVGGYSERRAYITNLFAPVIKLVDEEDSSIHIDLGIIACKSEAIYKAVTDAKILMRNGSYDSAFERIHTALHGYVRELLNDYNVIFGKEESLPSLFAKLYDYYANVIQPPEVGERIKKILRSAGGIMNAVNELRNHNTLAHPNVQLIQEREAQLVIMVVQDIVAYIEDIDKGINKLRK